jgi:hexosaminidase
MLRFQIFFQAFIFTVQLQIRSTRIVDFPRFPYRSLLLDSARHFLPKQLIFDNLDLMAMNKLNILHWHLTDNEAFPFKSDIYPDLRYENL